MPVSTFQPAVSTGARSGWLMTTPLSTIAIVTALLPVVTFQAAGTWVWALPHSPPLSAP